MKISFDFYKVVKKKVKKKNQKCDLPVRINQCYSKHSITLTFITTSETFLHFKKQTLLLPLLPNLPFVFPKDSQNKPRVHLKI